MNGDNCVKLFIDLQYTHSAGSTKMFYSADSSTSFVNESQSDLLNLSTNSFACGQYDVD